MNLQQAIDQRRQNTENQFYTNLMRYAIHDSPQFDMSGKNPQFIGGKADAMPSKTQLWNQYVAIKGGRMNPQDLMMFEQQYAQIKMAHRNKQMSQLQQLSTRGFSDVKIKNMIKFFNIMNIFFIGCIYYTYNFFKCKIFYCFVMFYRNIIFLHII